MSNPTIASLAKAENPLALQALFYTDSCKTHLDLGSNDGRTLRGLDKSTLTAVDLYAPSVEVMRADGIDAFLEDVRMFVQRVSAIGGRWDRVTCFDCIEHLPKLDGEKLLDQVELIAGKEILFFVPIETPEIEATEKWQEFRSTNLSLHPDGQRQLHAHLSRWAPEEFSRRGYLTMVLPNFHYDEFGAFFAAKYRDPAEQSAALARMQEFASKPQPRNEKWGHLGKGSGASQALFIKGTERMFWGDGVTTDYGARIETIPEYGGVKHTPTLTIGDGTTAEFFLTLACAESITIGRDCMIAGHVMISDHNHGFGTDRLLHGQPLTVKPVKIGNSVFIGEGAFIGKGVTVGDHAVIGAGSVVTKDVAAGAVVGGVPAREIQWRAITRYMPRVLIVIPTIDPYSERIATCLTSIEAHTPESYQLLVIEDRERQGFAATCNKGVAQINSQVVADYVCLMNDDTIVTPGWLSRMLSIMEHFPEVGLVGPVSDRVSGLQCRQPLAGPISQEVGRLVGFCLLIRRSVIEKIGGLDESMPFGLFTDDDYGLRAQAAGFKLRIAFDSFVQHECNATFRELSIDGSKAMDEAWKVFSRKWDAMRIPDGYRVQVPTFDERCVITLNTQPIEVMEGG